MARYRHVFGNDLKPELTFQGLDTLCSTWHSNGLAASSLYIAVPNRMGNQSSVSILRHDQPGRFDGLKGRESRLEGVHVRPVIDVQFHPFNDCIVATASEDAKIGIWVLPEDGLSENKVGSDMVLTDHNRKVGSLVFHRTANNILASAAGDKTVRIWDIETGQCGLCLEGFDDIPTDMSWNEDGSMLVTACKDKRLRLWDPRSLTVISNSESHVGAKGTRTTWITDANLIVTSGFSRQAERQVWLWDPRNMEVPINKLPLDQSAAILVPFYDPGRNLLYLVSKGDTSIRLAGVENGAVTILNQHTSQTPIQGVCWVPEPVLNAEAGEVAKFYFLHSQGVSGAYFTVPTKGSGYYPEYYPDVPAPEPALSASEWLGGANGVRRMIPFSDLPRSSGSQFIPSEPVARPNPSVLPQRAASASPSDVSPSSSSSSSSSSYLASSSQVKNSGSDRASLISEMKSIQVRTAAVEKELADLKLSSAKILEKLENLSE